MARPLASGKKAVDLAGGARRVGSRIRRDPPPPPERKVTTAELREREAWVIATGIMAVALAIGVILFAVARWSGWSPSHYTVRVEDRS
ncbi:hypothetical protein [Sphingomonas sp. LHG3406-1]|uniref:hypothetical protein n=1 Tax=Sphingomonas sp. LHG3406-1 TaxID=2804617 RepID=UPI00262B1B48|nr:hypothetical protein [Sphingomonas sp. LHG3406-1]